MKVNLSELKENYLREGLSEKNFEYALNAVKSKTERQYIFKNLTSDVRKVDKDLANRFLDELIIEKEETAFSVILTFFGSAIGLFLLGVFFAYIGFEKASVIPFLLGASSLFFGLYTIYVSAKTKLKRN